MELAGFLSTLHTYYSSFLDLTWLEIVDCAFLIADKFGVQLRQFRVSTTGMEGATTQLTELLRVGL